LYSEALNSFTYLVQNKISPATTTRSFKEFHQAKTKQETKRKFQAIDNSITDTFNDFNIVLFLVDSAAPIEDSAYVILPDTSESEK